MKENKQFITALDNIINQFQDNLNKVYPTRPSVKKDSIILIE